MCSWDEETGHIDVHTGSYGWPLACRRSRGPQPGGGTGSRPAPGGIVELEEEFRAILRWGEVPDYAATVQKQKAELPRFRDRLDALDPSEWSVHAKIDYLLLRSEMDRLEFDLYVWRQTSRNPSFYVNQAIRNVGQLLTGGRYMCGDVMPYSKERAQRILEA